MSVSAADVKATVQQCMVTTEKTGRLMVDGMAKVLATVAAASLESFNVETHRPMTPAEIVEALALSANVLEQMQKNVANWQQMVTDLQGTVRYLQTVYSKKHA
ncbi:MAG TPA: hypothetical protein VD902_21750 [Symbiobacteriaceae bacterium]|nr:hypothetical protein [Symbiobacteriaceae bacterium]